MKFLNNILHWASGMGRVFRNEFRLILGDVGVMLFFFALPLAYPVDPGEALAVRCVVKIFAVIYAGICRG